MKVWRAKKTSFEEKKKKGLPWDLMVDRGF
jgi:hypothetical protein